MNIKEQILARTNNGMDIFRYYIPGDWKVDRNFLNPFYQDKHASMRIHYYSPAQRYVMKDFGDERFSGDCFALVGRLMGLDCKMAVNFNRILDKIIADLGLMIDLVTFSSGRPKQVAEKIMAPLCRPKQVESGNGKSVEEVSKSMIAAQPKELSPFEQAWWEQYGISAQVLERYGVSSVAALLSGRGEIRSSEEEPIFLYTAGQTKKIYRPYSKCRFLYLSKESDYVFGWEQLPAKGSMVIITGGEKDVMTLAAMGFSAICLNSETADVPRWLMDSLHQRFNDIVLLYDVDETGKRCSAAACEKWKEFGVTNVLLPLTGEGELKDVSDFVLHRSDAFPALETLIRESLAAKCDAGWQKEEVCDINFNAPPVEPEPLIKIDGQIIATPGSLLCITGGPGTGKSNYASCMVAGALNTMGMDADTLGLWVRPNKDEKAILMFDTEQSEYQSYKNLSRLLKRVHLERHPDCLQMLNLCKVTRSKRLGVIRSCMEGAAKRHNGIHSVLIDGLADLISSCNEEQESVKLIEELHALAMRYNTVIAGVVHVAGVPGKVRGHLGSEFERKASGVIAIEKDVKHKCSVVKVTKLREGSSSDTRTGCFEWGKSEGYHVCRAI